MSTGKYEYTEPACRSCSTRNSFERVFIFSILSMIYAIAGSPSIVFTCSISFTRIFAVKCLLFSILNHGVPSKINPKGVVGPQHRRTIPNSFLATTIPATPVTTAAPVFTYSSYLIRGSRSPGRGRPVSGSISLLARSRAPAAWRFVGWCPQTAAWWLHPSCSRRSRSKGSSSLINFRSTHTCYLLFLDRAR